MALLLVYVSGARTVERAGRQFFGQFEERKLAGTVNDGCQVNPDRPMIHDLQNDWTAPSGLNPGGRLMHAQPYSGVCASSFNQSDQVTRDGNVLVSEGQDELIWFQRELLTFSKLVSLFQLFGVPDVKIAYSLESFRDGQGEGLKLIGPLTGTQLYAYRTQCTAMQTSFMRQLAVSSLGVLHSPIFHRSGTCLRIKNLDGQSVMASDGLTPLFPPLFSPNPSTTVRRAPGAGWE